jgi:hypothetical protein
MSNGQIWPHCPCPHGLTGSPWSQPRMAANANPGFISGNEPEAAWAGGSEVWGYSEFQRTSPWGC